MSKDALDKLYEKKKGYYANPRPEMLAFLPQTSKKVLDIGCGKGDFAAALKNQSPVDEVWGIDISTASIEVAKTLLDTAICTDLTEDVSVLPDNYFDTIYFNDMLEHIVDPKSLLQDLTSKISEDGVVIASIPNIRHFKVLLMLLKDKDFKYEQAGVMDETHLRFFTRKSMVRLFESAGYEIQSISPINKSKSIRPKLMKLLTLGLIGNDISYLQYVVVAKPARRSYAGKSE